MCVPAGEAFAVGRDAAGIEELVQRLARLRRRSWWRWRRPAASRPWWRRAWPRPACRWWWSTRPRCGPSPRRSASGPRPTRSMPPSSPTSPRPPSPKPARCPMRRRSSWPTWSPAGARSSQMIVAERQREKRATAKRLKKSIARLLKALQKELSERRRRYRRRGARLAGLAREGGPARLRARHRPDHRPHPDRRDARTGQPRPPPDRRPGRAWPPGPGSPANGGARASSAAAAPPCAPPSSWPPWSPAGTIRSSRAFHQRLIAAGKPKWSPSSPSPESSSPSSTPSSGTKHHGKPLDRQDSRSPRRDGEKDQAALRASPLSPLAGRGLG